MGENVNVWNVTSLISAILIALFFAGALAYLFVLSGGELAETQYVASSGTIDNETFIPFVTSDTGSNSTSICSSVRNGAISSISAVYLSNGTDPAELIPSGNYSFSGCTVSAVSGYIYANLTHNVTYTYSYDANSTSSEVIDDAKVQLSTVPDWFSIIIACAVILGVVLFVIFAVKTMKVGGA